MAEPELAPLFYERCFAQEDTPLLILYLISKLKKLNYILLG